jgi:hypothetical protein
MNGRTYRPILVALDLLLEPGTVAELRELDRDGRAVSGYFDDPGNLADAFEPMGAAGNPCIGYFDYTNLALKFARAVPVVAEVLGGSDLPADTKTDGLYGNVNGNHLKNSPTLFGTSITCNPFPGTAGRDTPPTLNLFRQGNRVP